MTKYEIRLRNSICKEIQDCVEHRFYDETGLRKSLDAISDRMAYITKVPIKNSDLQEYYAAGLIMRNRFVFCDIYIARTLVEGDFYVTDISIGVGKIVK